jgi:hypothetical protein
VTSPFQSIICTDPNPPGDQAGRGQQNLLAEVITKDTYTDEFATLSPSLKEQAFDRGELSGRIETGICEAYEAEKPAAVYPIPPHQRKPLQGGVYSQDEVLELLNSHYMIGKSEQEIAVFRIKDDGSLAFAPPEQFKLDVANIFVQPSGRLSKPIPVEKFWTGSRQRHQRKIVFKPGGKTQPDEFNLWRGFEVEPRNGWQKQRRLMKHIWEIICRCDKAKFKYLIRWLAWAVQNPDKHPETVVILKSRKQGTGKSTLGLVMFAIFGKRHGAIVDDKQRLIGQFNDWIEPICFILAEEILWAGDHKTADKLKSMMTAPTNQIERKGGAVLHIPNRLHIIMTTNHDHAVSAGVGDRRNVVFDVSDAHACDKSWFDPLYRELDNGGTSEFLHFLQNLKLGDWHPREILKTPETTEQQRMSGDSVAQWSQACIDADAIIGTGRAPYGNETTLDLGTTIPLPALREAYTGFCAQNKLHPSGVIAFGTACADMFGPRKRLSAPQNNATGRRMPRPWGYHVPESNEWQEKVDARLGIKN